MRSVSMSLPGTQTARPVMEVIFSRAMEVAAAPQLKVEVES
jgi:hypothetical protein